MARHGCRHAYLFIGFLICFSFTPAIAGDYSAFPVSINHDVYKKLPLAYQYAYLRDITDALQTFITQAESVRDLATDTTCIESDLQCGEIPLPRVDPETAFININTWHINLLLRFLSQLPVNVFPTEQKLDFEAYVAENLPEDERDEATQQSHRFALEIEFVSSDPTPFHRKRGRLATNPFWREWHTFEGIQGLRFSGPGEETIDYILAPRSLRIAAALIDDYSDDLGLWAHQDVMTTSQITDNVETGWGLLTLIPEAYRKYKSVFSAWQDIESRYDAHIVARIDANRLRPNIDTPRKPTLLQLARVTTAPDHRFLWGTIRGRDRVAENPTEDRLFALLNELHDLLRTNIGHLIHQARRDLGLRSSQAAETDLIQQLSDQFALTYEPLIQL